jgi:hypothetical protein
MSTLLSLALDEGGWPVACPGCFISEKRAPGNHWIGGWVSQGTSLQAVVNEKDLTDARNLTPDI